MYEESRDEDSSYTGKVNYSYIQTAVNISLLLESGAVDFAVTGCSSGQGMNTPYQRGVHCLITSGLWLITIVIFLYYTCKYYGFPIKEDTLKVIGEIKGKDLDSFWRYYSS